MNKKYKKKVKIFSFPKKYYNLFSKSDIEFLEKLISGLRVIILSINVALLGTLATKFFSNGSGILEILLISFPGFISLINVRQTATKLNKKYVLRRGIKYILCLLNKIELVPRIYNILKFLIIFLVGILTSFISVYGFAFLFLISVWISQPFFSEFYNKKGSEMQKMNNLIEAESFYKKSISLNSSNFDSHFKLASIYEYLQDTESANKAYIIAAKGKNLDAYNNLSYLYILEHKNAKAFFLIKEGISILGEKQGDLENMSSEEKLDLIMMSYNLHKNHGWASYNMKRDDLAEDHLSIAINNSQETVKIEGKDVQVSKYLVNPGVAHCLYAKVMGVSSGWGRL